MIDRARVTLTPDDVLVVHATGDPLQLWDELRRAYLARRLTFIGRDAWRFPATTYADVIEVATVFEKLLAQIDDPSPEHAEQVARWRRAYHQIFEAYNHHNPTELFGENELFWLFFTLRLALHLSAVVERTRPALLRPFARRPRFVPER